MRHGFFFSPNIILGNNSRKKRWVGHIARMEEKRNSFRPLVAKHKRKKLLRTLGINVRIILKWILSEKMGRRGVYSPGSGQGQVSGCCEYGNEPSVSIKCGEFFDSLTACKVFTLLGCYAACVDSWSPTCRESISVYLQGGAIGCTETSVTI
jgi:hypothetical protein